MGCSSSSPVPRGAPKQPTGSFKSGSGAPPPPPPLPNQGEGGDSSQGKPSKPGNASSAANGRKKPVLAVFPAGGRIGVATLQSLTRYPLLAAQRHFDVVGVCRSGSGPEAIKAELDADALVSFRVGGDLESVDSAASALEGVDLVFLIAPFCEDSHLLLENGIRAAAKAGVKHVFLQSVTGYEQMKDASPSYLLANRFRIAETVLEEACEKRKPEIRALMVGLDNAGKTTLLNKLVKGVSEPTTPTIGFNVETIERDDVGVVLWDVGGQANVRSLWGHYALGTDLIVYVVDSSDRKRIKESKEALFAALRLDDLPKHAALLVLANKQDLGNVMSLSEVAEKLGLKVVQRKVLVLACSAARGTGLKEALDAGVNLAMRVKPMDAANQSAGTMAFTHLRAAYFMDNFLASRASIVNKGTLFGCYGKATKLPLVALADYARVAASVMVQHQDYRNQAIDVAGTESWTGNEIASELSAVLDCKVKYLDMDPAKFQESLTKLGVPLYQIEETINQWQVYATGRMQSTLSNVVERITQHSAVPLGSFFRKHRSFFKLQTPPLVAVLPANGLLGLACIRSIQAHPSNLRVRAVCRDASLVEDVARTFPGVDSCKCADLMDPDALDAALIDVDYAFIAAPSTELRVALGLNSINACAKQRVAHVVFISVVAKADSDVAIEFGAMEKTLESCDDMSYTVLKIGALAESIANLSLNGDVLYGLNSRVVGIPIKDVGKAAAQVFLQPELFNRATISVTGSEAADWEQVALYLGRTLGRAVHAKPMGPEDLLAAVKSNGGSNVVASSYVAQVSASTQASQFLGHLVAKPTSWEDAFAS